MDPDLPQESATIAGNGRGLHDGDIGGRSTGKPVRKDEIVLDANLAYLLTDAV